MGFASLYPSYIMPLSVIPGRAEPGMLGEMARPAGRTSIATRRRNLLIGFICIHRYRIVGPEFIAASGS
jgi:hypothetical protein